MENETKLLRHLLASIDLSDTEEEIGDEEYNKRMADADIFYTNHFEKLLKAFIKKQLEFIAKEAESLEALSFGRGTINGFILLKEWFEEQIKESHSRFEGKEEEETGEIKPV